MRPTTVALILVILISVVAAIFVENHKAEGHTGYYRNTGNALNLREGPGAEYAVIGRVPANAVVKAYGHRGNWLKLRVLDSGAVGWAWLWNFHQSSYTAPPPPPPQPTLQTCWDTTWRWTACAPYWIAKAIYDAARAWGVPYWAMMGVASCESAFDPNAWLYSPPDNVYGLYQFRPSTMAWVYPGGNVWSVYDSAWAAAKLMATAPWHFACAFRIGYI